MSRRVRRSPARLATPPLAVTLKFCAGIDHMASVLHHRLPPLSATAASCWKKLMSGNDELPSIDDAIGVGYASRP